MSDLSDLQKDWLRLQLETKLSEAISNCREWSEWTGLDVTEEEFYYMRSLKVEVL